jgi:hypothetical protein
MSFKRLSEYSLQNRFSRIRIFYVFLVKSIRPANTFLLGFCANSDIALRSTKTHCDARVLPGIAAVSEQAHESMITSDSRRPRLHPLRRGPKRRYSPNL